MDQAFCRASFRRGPSRSDGRLAFARKQSFDRFDSNNTHGARLPFAHKPSLTLKNPCIGCRTSASFSQSLNQRRPDIWIFGQEIFLSKSNRGVDGRDSSTHNVDCESGRQINRMHVRHRSSLIVQSARRDQHLHRRVLRSARLDVREELLEYFGGDCDRVGRCSNRSSVASTGVVLTGPPCVDRPEGCSERPDCGDGVPFEPISEVSKAYPPSRGS